MGTRTAIFKEVEPNKYEGIYAHCDGYIGYTGEMLIKYFTGNNDILEVIREKKPLASIGTTTEVISRYEDEKRYKEVMENRKPKYTGTYFVEGVSEYEYFQAKSLEEIRNFEYLNYDENGNVKGYYSNKGEFKAHQGSANNGYLYVQSIDGQWYVSVEDDSEREMSAFVPLENVVTGRIP
ncbi:hypothetical protein BUY35_00080 [Staphylococcus cohnii]|nr:hypothetical protein BUY35_00080 [Staphylococcus cohnii]